MNAFRSAVRALLARRALTVFAIVTIALGIGATVTMFSIADAILIRPIDFGTSTERVVSIHSLDSSRPTDLEEQGLSWPELMAARNVTAFERVEGFVFRNFNIDAEADGGGHRVRGGSVTPGLFAAIDERPVLGRDFTSEDAADFGFEYTVILSDELWRAQFGADPRIVGRDVRINGRALQVVGVMRPGFSFPFRQHLWLAYAPRQEQAATSRFLMSFALLKRGVAVDAVNRELAGVTTQLRTAYPDAMKGVTLKAFDVKTLFAGPTSAIWASILLLGAGLVLVVACTNLASVLIARSIERRQEFAVRSALGASRALLTRSVLAEAGLLSICAGVAGFVFARFATPALAQSFSEPLPYWLTLSADMRAFAVALGLAVLTAAILGFVTARRASVLDLAHDLRVSSRGGSSGIESRRAQTALIVSQVAVSVALFALSALLVKSGDRLLTASSGVEEEGLLTFRAYIAGDAYDSPKTRLAALDALAARLEAEPGVARAAFLDAIPADDTGEDVRVALDASALAVTGAGETGIPGNLVLMSRGAFEALGAPLLAGETLAAEDQGQQSISRVVIGEQLAKLLFSDPRQAVGRSFAIRRDREIVPLSVRGVARDIQWEEFGESTDFSVNAIYAPFAPNAPRSIAVAARLRSPAALTGLAQAAPRLIKEAIPGAAAYDIRSMKQVREFTSWEQRFFGRVMAGFGLAAVVAAATGLYGLLAYFVASRRREIGVRLALGARPQEVALLVIGRGARLAALGSLVGVGLGLLLGRAASGILFGVGTLDIAGPLAGALALLLVVILSSVFPAWRASRVDAGVALRTE